MASTPTAGLAEAFPEVLPSMQPCVAANLPTHHGAMVVQRHIWDVETGLMCRCHAIHNRYWHRAEKYEKQICGM
jgi:hypothetical protein